MDPEASGPRSKPGFAKRGGRVWFAVGAKGVGVLLGVWMLVVGPGLRVLGGVGAGPTEYQLKAAFLYNLVKVTTWPDDLLGGPSVSIVVGLVGGDPFGGALEEVVRGRTVGGREVRVRRIKDGEPLSGCQVLFVSRSAGPEAVHAVTEAGRGGVLTVSETDGFCAGGGMVNLEVTGERRIQLEVNPDAVRAAGLRLGSRLLGLPSIKRVRAGGA